MSDATCSSGKAPIGRVEPPIIELADSAITVTYRVRFPQGDEQTCQGSDPAPIELVLPETLGHRKLLDGGSDPPRDASKPAP